jgi:uncharacterized protein (TIGR03032 family)
MSNVTTEPLPAETNTATPPEPISIHGTGDVMQWMHDTNVSLAFSSYDMGKFFLFGRDAEGRLAVSHRNFDRCMGIALVDNRTFYMSSLYQIWKFTHVMPKGQSYQDFDRLYAPLTAHFTGEINVHDLALDHTGRLIFINTAFSCLSTLSPQHSFEVLWHPAFITQLVPEDRCHLNGLAMEQGHPRYVSMFSATDSKEGWRDHKVGGGVIVDVQTNDIICRGLSMPHSPRVYRDTLWVLNSATGYFGYVDRQKGCFEAVTFCPGFVRGLTFIGDYAIVGLSKIKKKDYLAELPIQKNLIQHGFESSQCGFYIINLKTMQLEHSIDLSGSIHHIYDVVLLENVVKPLSLGIEQDHIRRAISLPPSKDNENGEFFILSHMQ